MMNTIGLIISSKIEALLFLQYFPVKKKLKLEQFEAYYFKIKTFELFLVVCDKNVKSASHATELLIGKIHPLLIISFGTAQTTDRDLNVGDVICGSAVTTLENNVFEQFIVLSSLFNNIRKFIFEKILSGNTQLFTGTIITISDKEILNNFDKIRFSHPVFDTETIGIAQITYHKKNRLLALRGINHNNGNKSVQNIHSLLDFYWNFNKKNVLFQLLLKLWMLIELPNYFKGKYSASKNVNEIVFSILQALTIDDNRSNDIDFII